MAIHSFKRTGLNLLVGAGLLGCTTTVSEDGATPVDNSALTDEPMPAGFIGETVPQPPDVPPTLMAGPPRGGLEVADEPLQLPSVPISGGTLAIRDDKSVAAVADPDRDKVYIVDLHSKQVQHSVPLQESDEPGRLVFDDEGTVHVATRRGGQLVSIDVESGEVSATRDVCAAPRGVAFEAPTRRLHVACQTGELVTFNLDGAGEPRRLDFGRDLRDVVVVEDQLRISRFKSAEILSLNAEGVLLATNAPAVQMRQRLDPSGELLEAPFAPAVAWRMVAVADGEALMVHQENLTDEIKIQGERTGGYGGFGCSGGIVGGAVSLLKEGRLSRLTTLGGLSHTDIAINGQGTFAAVAAGESLNPTLGGNVFFGQLDMTGPEAETIGLAPAQTPGGISPTVLPPSSPFDGEACSHSSVYVESEVTSVGFGPDGTVVVQSREPARLTLIDPLTKVQQQIELDFESRRNTGSRLFHGNTGTGISCASCHPEGAEDGHVWTFEGVGPRRSQDISGGVLSTLPLHWDGEFSDFNELVQEVMLRRMQSRHLNEAQVEALGSWINQLPAPAAKRLPTDTLEIGRAAFTKAKCGECHGGETLTNNLSHDVGTGAVLQTPSLRGIGARAPFMHSGCAETLAERFDPTCGGDQHGDVASLSEPELNALVDYLETL